MRKGLPVIAAITAVRDDAVLIERTVKHLQANGVEHIHAIVGPSEDGTADVCEHLGVDVTLDPEPPRYFFPDYQSTIMTGLAQRAMEHGADWIIPFDADEFICATDGGSITDALQDCPDDKLFMRMLQHYNWDERDVAPKPLPKVAFRARPGVLVAAGNHDCSLPGGQYDVLCVRELQYLDVDHFIRKVRQQIAVTDPHSGACAHSRSFEGMSDYQLREWWSSGQPLFGMTARTPVYDPIPTP